MMRHLGLEPDPWQIEVLEGNQPRLLLNCSRQAGKSTTVAVLALTEALFRHGRLILLVSRSFRQASELFRKVTAFYHRLKKPNCARLNAEELALDNGSRIVCLPCKEETIRGYSGVSLLLIDEAAKVPDDVYRAVRPMLATSNGRLICLSTPYGKRGFFWHAWAKGGDDWARIEIPASKVPRIMAQFLETEHRALGDSWYRQEYCCSFEALEGLVYPNLSRCIIRPPAPAGVRRVGGIDFGFRNPFAAVWGHVTESGVLVLTGEHYDRKKSLDHHAQRLPRDVTWAVDPSGATEKNEFIMAGFNIHDGNNALRPGIAAVNARIESNMLMVVEGACPNLLAEAALYRYSDDPAERNAEIPIDEHNHALSALRYLIMMLDAYRMAGRAAPKVPPPKPQRPWLSVWNPALWTPIWPPE
jgi:hypothetical protein